MKTGWIAQALRNAYDARDRDLLERMLAKVEELERGMSLRRLQCPRCGYKFSAYIGGERHVECPSCKVDDKRRAEEAGGAGTPSYTFDAGDR
jgi:hypothetical protein